MLLTQGNKKGNALLKLYEYFVREGDVPARHSGWGRNVHGLLNVPGLRADLKLWLGTKRKGFRLPQFRKHLHDNILPAYRDKFTGSLQFRALRKKKYSERSCQRLLIELGYTYRKLNKGVYSDGANRADVVWYLKNHFIPIVNFCLPFIQQYEGEAMDQPLEETKELRSTHITNVDPEHPSVRKSQRRKTSSRKTLDAIESERIQREKKQKDSQEAVDHQPKNTIPGHIPVIPEEYIAQQMKRHKEKYGQEPKWIEIIVQDETIWKPYDFETLCMWYAKNTKQGKRKDHGKAMMLSDFYSSRGRLVPKTKAKEEDLKALTGIRLTNVQQRFDDIMKELITSSAPCTKLVVALLKCNQRIAGNAVVTLLSKGVNALIEYLEATNDAGESLHDLDVYNIDPKKPLDESVYTNLNFTENLSLRKEKGAVKEVVLTSNDGKKYKLDLVDFTKSSFTRGTDLFGDLALRWDEEKQCPVFCNLFTSSEIDSTAKKPLLHPHITVTVENALKYGKGDPVNCYVLNRDVMPTSLTEDPATKKQSWNPSNVNSRFRWKLRNREESGLINTIPCYAEHPLEDGNRRFFSVGAQYDGYFRNDDLMNQARLSIQAFNDEFGPDYMALFIFDNATNHGAYSEDALNVNVLNEGDQFSKARNPPKPCRNGYYRDENGALKEQIMNHEVWNGTRFVTQRKGMRSTCLERNFPRAGEKKPKMQCELCEKERSHGFDGTPDWSRRRCCLKNFLRWEPDFMEQKSMLQEMIEDAGHAFLTLPKFHPELNWIEMVWGYVKAYVRRNMSELQHPTVKDCIRYIKEGFERVDAALCRKFQRLSFRYMDALEKGASGMLADWLVKKFRSHRGLPAEWEKHLYEWVEKNDMEIEDLPESFNQYLKKDEAQTPGPQKTTGEKRKVIAMPIVTSTKQKKKRQNQLFQVIHTFTTRYPKYWTDRPAQFWCHLLLEFFSTGISRYP